MSGWVSLVDIAGQANYNGENGFKYRIYASDLQLRTQKKKTFNNLQLCFVHELRALYIFVGPRAIEVLFDSLDRYFCNACAGSLFLELMKFFPS